MHKSSVSSVSTLNVYIYSSCLARYLIEITEGETRKPNSDRKAEINDSQNLEQAFESSFSMIFKVYKLMRCVLNNSRVQRKCAMCNTF